MAVATPSGNDKSKVVSSVYAEPTIAPQRPASSGSRESPAVNSVVLSWRSMLPSAFSSSIQASF
jgi:hypothetical protein